MFTIAVKCGPLDGILIVAPVEFNLTAVMTDCEFSPRMCAGKTNDQRSELMLRSRGINMRLELVMRSLVNLFNQICNFGGYTLSL